MTLLLRGPTRLPWISGAFCRKFAGSPVCPRVPEARAPAADSPRSWETSHLRPLNPLELEAVVAVMPCWLHQREWRPPQHADVPLLWEYIDRQGLGGALGALAAANLAPGGELSDLAKARYFSNMVHCERARRTGRKILTAARDLGLPIANLKGPVLAYQAYDDPGIRAFSDLDLWARSRADVFQLLGALECPVTEESDLHGPVRRLRSPGSILATLDGWEIEIRYPSGEATDPMIDLLNRYAGAPPSPDDDCLAAPDPAWHMVLLLLHMSWYHYYSRFVWFLDLAALVSRQRPHMDFDWILAESRRLHAGNLLGAASRFCRDHIDPSFPAFPMDPAAWSHRFLCLVTDPDTIARGRFSLHQRRRGHLLYILWFRILRHFLLSDPPPRYLANRPPERWLIATIVRAFRMRGTVMPFAAKAFVGLLMFPLARLTAWVSPMRKINRGGGS